MDRSMPGFPVHHQLPEVVQSHVLELVMPFSHLILTENGCVQDVNLFMVSLHC